MLWWETLGPFCFVLLLSCFQIIFVASFAAGITLWFLNSPISPKHVGLWQFKMRSSISYHMVAGLDKQCILFLSFEKFGKLLHKKSFVALWNNILRRYPIYILFFMWLHLYAGNSMFLLDEIFLGRFCYCIEYCLTSGSVVSSLTHLR